MTKCKDCRYWVQYHDNIYKGECQRWTPEPVTSYYHILVFGWSTTEALWPITGLNDCCGEGEVKAAKGGEA